MAFPSDTGRSERSRACPGSFARPVLAGRILLSLFLAATLAFLPLDVRINCKLGDCIENHPANIQREGCIKALQLEIIDNSAFGIAPAIPVAGSAAAALAAELGISTGALMAGCAAVVAGGTGLYLAQSLTQNQYDHLWTGDLTGGYEQNWADEYQGWSLGGQNKSWNDLTDEEKAEFDSPADYVASQQIWLQQVLFPELFQTGSGGDPEPSNEPDPNNEPEKNERWNTLRDALTVLGTGGAVGFSGTIGAWAEGLGSGLHDLLFGSDDDDWNDANSLMLDLSFTIDIDGHDLQFESEAPPYGVGNYNGYMTYMTPAFWFGVNGSYMGLCESSGPPWEIRDKPVPVTVRWNGTNFTLTPSEAGMLAAFNPGQTHGPGILSYRDLYPPLNANYSGGYIFLDAEGNRTNYYDGSAFESPLNQDNQYGQMQGTPDGLSSSITGDTYNNYVTNTYPQTAPDGTTKAIVIPEILTGPDGVPEYSDYVMDLPSGDVNPGPGTDPDPGPGTDPDPDPGTDPDPDPGTDPETDFDNDFPAKVTELLAQPLEQLFPFCLITDLRLLVEKVENAYTVEGSDQISVPLTDFGVDGMESLDLDLEFLTDLGAQVKPWVSLLFVVSLLVGTFAFFLKRGGE